MGEITPRRFRLKTGETCVVRCAEERDAAVLLTNAREIFTTPYVLITLEEFDMTEEKERAWIADHRAKPGWIALVPEIDGRVVGILDFQNGSRRRIEHRGTLGMSVLAEWRGRGVGDALMTTLLDWARESPLIDKVCLAVFVDNAPAIALYRKHGFVEEGRRIREIKLGAGAYSDDFIMYRLVK
jgi:RimJ/RimL family protein N-acetyltransferase